MSNHYNLLLIDVFELITFYLAELNFVMLGGLQPDLRPEC